MNYRLAKKITQCRSTLCNNYVKVMQARQVMQTRKTTGWIFLEFTQADHDRAMRRLNE